MAQRIDTLIAKAWNVIKKTGDSMFETPGDPESGWLTLAKDARDPLHAVPLRQLQATVGAIHLPYRDTGYYGYTFAAGLHPAENTLFGAAGLAYGRMSPMFVGESASWDRIGALFRYNSSPGTPPNMVWGVFSLDPDTLFPDALLQTGTLTTASTTLLWVEATITLSTTSKWLGLAYICDSLSESVGVQEWSEEPVVRTIPGYSPYGITVVTTTDIRPNHCLYASTATPTVIPPAGSWSATESDPNNNRGISCGLHLRRSA